MDIEVAAVLPDGRSVTVLKTPLPQSSWQDDRPISLSCDEAEKTAVYRVSIANRHPSTFKFIHFYTDAKKNNWESEAGFTLRSIVRSSEHPKQSPETCVKTDSVLDISKSMDKDGNLNWDAPAGQWTVLRIGHVFTEMYNGPSPREGRGPECDKLNVKGADAHFAGYIGKLADDTLSGGLMKGMHLDSWECKTQTWTTGMEEQFAGRTKYALQKYLPALFGFVTDNQETTSRFLCDWRRTINDLLVNAYYGQMAKRAHEKGIGVTYETASGDIFPADIMEYYKSCDVPQTEFWQPMGGYVGSINFKPVRPAASAMRLYGKTRLGAEAFTSFALTWDEHLSMLKEVANYNCVQGVTHLLFHTYTHNPLVNQLPPGTSFGGGIGTPFLRGQTWWKYMTEFTAYLGRCNYLWERGKPVSDVLWYLGDEIDHKPDQNAPFPDGYKYDYCNPDVLLHRLAVKDGHIVTPEGIRYRILWIPENERMLPETLEKLVEFANQGAVIVANPPKSLATLSGGKASQERFDKAVKELRGKKNVLADTSIGDALKQCGIEPDVTGGDVLWLHRQTEGADWYYVAAPVGKGFKGMVSFCNNRSAECWDPITGEITPLATKAENNRRSIAFDLAQSESCFVVFRNAIVNGKTGSANGGQTKTVPLTPWQLSFPAGWGIDSELTLPELKPWKDLDVSPEGRAFSGTATYSATFDVDSPQSSPVTLDLGKVEMIATVSVNGQKVRTLWCPPFKLDITKNIKRGRNELKVEITSSWFNRLVYDAGQPKEKRKTWLITGPKKESPLRESGLLGPVVISQ
jgi:hypothetical protein